MISAFDRQASLFTIVSMIRSRVAMIRGGLVDKKFGSKGDLSKMLKMSKMFTVTSRGRDDHIGGNRRGHLDTWT